MDWAAVRGAYEAGEERVAAIRGRFGVTRDEMRARCRAEARRRRPTDAGGLARLRRVQKLARVEAELRAAEAAEDSVPWAEVRAAYEAGEESVAAIRARFGLTERQFRQAREAGGWASRPRVAEPGSRAGRRPATAERLEKRLGRAIEAGLAELEAARAAGAPAEPGEARRLAELARALAALKRLEAGPAAAGGGAAAARARAARPQLAPGEILMPRNWKDVERWGMTPDEVRRADEHWMRQELKKRLDILAANQRWHEEQAARKAEEQEREGPQAPGGDAGGPAPPPAGPGIRHL